MEEYETDILDDSDDSFSEENSYSFIDTFQQNNSGKIVSISDSLEKVGRFLFAEDVISYIASEFHGVVYAAKLKPNSEIIYNPFNDIIKRAVYIIRQQLITTDCSSLDLILNLCKSCKLYYETFIEAILDHYSESNIKAGPFLCCCVYFAELALKCYRPDFTEVLDSAVYAILDAFALLTDGRYELYTAARNICISEDRSFYIDYKFVLCPEIKCLEGQNHTHNEFVLNIPLTDSKKKIKDSQSGLEQLVICDSGQSKVDLTLNKVAQLKDKLCESDTKKADTLSLVNKDNTALSSDNAYILESEERTSLPKIHFFEDIFKDVMSIIRSEALLFLEIYLKHKNQGKLEIHEISKISVIKDSTEHLDVPSIEMEDGIIVSQQIISPNTSDDKISIPIIQPTTVINMVISQYEMDSQESLFMLLDQTDPNFPITKSKNSGFIQDQFTSHSEFNAFTQEESESYNGNNISNQNNMKICVEPKHMDFAQDQLPFCSQSIEDCIRKEIEVEVADSNISVQDTDLEITNSNVFNSAEKEFVSQSVANVEETLVTELADPLIQEDYEKNKDFDIIPNCESNVTADQNNATIFAVYKREDDTNAENMIYLKGDSFLFAEDFIRYISNEFHSISYPESKFEEYRDILYNAFNERVKEVIHFIRGEIGPLNNLVFVMIANIKEEHANFYRKYVAAILNHYAESGLNSDVFLYYSLHFVELSLKLCKINESGMLDLTVCSILDAFCLLKDDWNEFAATVEKILKFSKDSTVNEGNCMQFNHILNMAENVENLDNDSLKTLLGWLKNSQTSNIELKENEPFYFKKKLEKIFREILMAFESINPLELLGEFEINNNTIIKFSESNTNEMVIAKDEEISEEIGAIRIAD